MPETSQTRAHGKTRNRIACEDIDDPTLATCPLAPDADLLLQQLLQQGEADRLLRRADLRPDRQVVGHRRRCAGSNTTARLFDMYKVPFGLPVAERSGCQRAGEQEQGQRHDLQVRDGVPLHARRDGVRALQRGLPPRRPEFAARGVDRPGAARRTGRTASRTTRSASRASGSTTSCSSTSRRS